MQIDNLSRIAEVVTATTAVPVIPGIIPVGVYPAGDVTRLYGDLQARAPGRFIAGLAGPQVLRPLQPLNDYLDQLDRGEPPVPPAEGYPCLRSNGAFFACIEKATGNLIVKLPARRVSELTAAGQALPFAPSGRTFREWAVFPVADPAEWRALLTEARSFVGG